MENIFLGFLWPKRRTQTLFPDLLKLGKLFLIAHNCPSSKFLKHKRLLGSTNIVRYARTLAVHQGVANTLLNICSYFNFLYYHSCYSMIGMCCCFVYCFFVFSQGYTCVSLIIWNIIVSSWDITGNDLLMSWASSKTKPVTFCIFHLVNLKVTS